MMDSSDEISDESPCFVVPDSQASMKKDRLHSLKIGQEQSCESGSSESVLPSSSSSSSSYTSSKNTSSDREELQLERIKSPKVSSIYFSRLHKENETTKTNRLTKEDSTEHQNVVQETSNSSNASPSIDREDNNSVVGLSDVQDAEKSCAMQSSDDPDNSPMFQCLQLSGDKNEELCHVDPIVKPLSGVLLHNSPGPASEKGMEKDKVTNNERQMISTVTLSPAGSLIKTLSNASTINSQDGSSVHEWQSMENNIDDKMFEKTHGSKADHNSSATVNINPLLTAECMNRIADAPKPSMVKALSPPAVSQDIFQYISNGIAATERIVKPVNNQDNHDVIIDSQDSLHLHLSQSQTTAISSETPPESEETMSFRDVIIPPPAEYGTCTKDEDVCQRTSGNLSKETGGVHKPNLILPVGNLTSSDADKNSNKKKAEDVLSNAIRVSCHEDCSQKVEDDAITISCNEDEEQSPLLRSSLSGAEENCDENSEIDGRLSLQKDISVNLNETLPASPIERSVFTNIKERFEATSYASPPEEELDPFNIRDEFYEPLSRRGKRRCDIESSFPSARKKKKSGKDREKWKERSNRVMGVKITRTRTTTTKTTSIEHDIEVIYRLKDGKQIYKETFRKVDEPTKVTTVTTKETQDEMEEIPGKITIDEDTGMKATRQVETLVLGSSEENNTVIELFDKSLEDKMNETAVDKIRGNDSEQLVQDASTIDSSPTLFPSPSTLMTNSSDRITTFSLAKGITSNVKSRKREKKIICHTPRASRVLHEGTRVFGLWYDKHYYPGVVQSKSRNEGEYRVVFDDGNTRNLDEHYMINVDYLPPEQPVMFCTNTGGEYISGVIKETVTKGDTVGYKIENWDRSEVIYCTRGDVMLSAEQVAIYLSLRECKNGASDEQKKISTDECRNNGDSIANSSGSQTPKSSHKSTGKKNAACTMNDVDNGRRVRRRLSKAMKASTDKSIAKRSSPRKHISQLCDTENQVLPKDNNLFRGYAFILTGNNVTIVPDENSPQEEEQDYIREVVINQLKAGGGAILDNFNDNLPLNRCFLLSNANQRTAKYFNALVLGVPCVSHVWIRDCCAQNKLISYQNYLLPSGRDLITDKLLEEQNHGDALRGLKVHLVGEDCFKQQWSKVLTAAGSLVVPRLPVNVLQKLQQGNDDSICDVIVFGGSHVAYSTIQKARLLNIPTVTIHWLKQCILTGKQVDYNAHHSFLFRLQERKF